MLVAPRSSPFRYGASPPQDREMSDERRRRRIGGRRNITSALRLPEETTSVDVTRPSSTTGRTTTEPVPVKSTPVAVPLPERNRTEIAETMPTTKGRQPSFARRKQAMPDSHRADSLPPAVAALLAVTAIPRPNPRQFHRRSSSKQRVSIDELVSEWKSEANLKPSYSSSPSLSILLEDTHDLKEQAAASDSGTSAPDAQYVHTRSTSSDSIPSLEEDDKSLHSARSPSTPGSLRSRKSSTNLQKRKEIARSLPTSQDCALDHPLIPLPSPSDSDDDHDDFFLPGPSLKATPPKPKQSFTSNLTLSLQALKRTALTSLSTLTSTSSSPINTQTQTQTQSFSSRSPFSPESLWSHPYIFPRFTSETRPNNKYTTATPPTQTQPRYHNQAPLTFEEQEAPFQRALHEPYLHENYSEREDGRGVMGAGSRVGIQLQPFHRSGKRKILNNTTTATSGAGKRNPDPTSEAGRALAAANAADNLGGVGLVRQREPRENSDFLRVVVLEMEMRRRGKLEEGRGGRARIWLPPRPAVVGPAEREVGEEGEKRVPRRWVGVSAGAA